MNLRTLIGTLLLFSMPTGKALGENHKPVVLFFLSPSQKQTSAVLERAIQSQVSDLDVTLFRAELPRSSGDLKDTVEMAAKMVQKNNGIAGFWYETVSRDQIFLYVIENRGDRILVRRIEEAEEGGRTEATAVIIRMTIAELKKGGKIGIEVLQASQEASLDEPQTAVASREDTVRIEAGQSLKGQKEVSKLAPPSPHYLFVHNLSYAYYVHSRQSPANHGMDILLGYRPIRDLTVFVEYTFLGPLKVQDEAVLLLYTRHPIRVGAKYTKSPFSRGEIGISAAFLFDYVSYETVSTSIVSGDQGHLLVGVFPRIEFAYEIASHFALSLSFGAEILINPEYYGHRSDGRRRVVLDGFRVQPWVMGGIVISHFEQK